MNQSFSSSWKISSVCFPKCLAIFKATIVDGPFDLYAILHSAPNTEYLFFYPEIKPRDVLSQVRSRKRVVYGKVVKVRSHYRRIGER